MPTPLSFPEDDSPDLSEQDVKTALPTGSPEDVAEHLGKPCEVCGAVGGRAKYRKLKRGPHFYSRVSVTCPQGHQVTHLFEMTWYLRRT